MLTGSTGSLGPYLLDELVRDETVATIYCLSRSADTESRQRKLMRGRGLSSDFGSKHVHFLHANLSKPYLGLGLRTYRQLLNVVTNIIHNAWQVSFNASLTPISPLLHGTRRLTDFSVSSKHAAGIFFVSSIGAVADADTTATKTVPETFEHNWNAAGTLAYGQSKLIAERILDTAYVPATICGVGQIAGPTTARGMWPKQEWLPSLVLSSVFLGCLPATLGTMDIIDWIPVDLVARSLVELDFASSASAERTAMFHTVNPAKTSWHHILPAIREHLQLESVPTEQWVKLLKSSDASEPDMNPATKLVDFFEGMAGANAKMAELSTEVSRGHRKTLAGLHAVDDGLATLWLQQWGILR